MGKDGKVIGGKRVKGGEGLGMGKVGGLKVRKSGNAMGGRRKGK